jgi:hypothetical protein
MRAIRLAARSEVVVLVKAAPVESGRTAVLRTEAML